MRVATLLEVTISTKVTLLHHEASYSVYIVDNMVVNVIAKLRYACIMESRVMLFLDF
jgi:hypothetical protein